MARETGIYRRSESRYWWIATTLSNGQRIRQSTGTEDRRDAEALLAQLKLEAFRQTNFGIKPERSWQEAVVRCFVEGFFAPCNIHTVFGDDCFQLIELPARDPGALT